MSSISPSAAFETLLKRLGPQGWWPVTPPGQTEPGYHPGRYQRLTEDQSAEVVIGAILTQNTAWTNVEKAIRALHGAEAMDLDRIIEMRPHALQRLVRSSGYFRQKASRLKTVAGHIKSRGGIGPWFKLELHALREDLLGVSGIGPETADSIILYAAGGPSFVVDAYTARVGGRVGWFDSKLRSGVREHYHRIQRFFEQKLPRDVQVYQEFHALIVALCKFYCRPEPLCSGCPLSHGCEYRRGIAA